jgi:hypothetical protein
LDDGSGVLSRRNLVADGSLVVAIACNFPTSARIRLVDAGVAILKILI